MDTFTANILIDLLIICIVSTAIALPLYQHIRKTHPHLAWNQQGNINTSSLTKADLTGILATCLIFLIIIILNRYGSKPETTNTPEPSSLNILISGILSQALPLGIAFACMNHRMNVIDTLNLRKPKLDKIIITSIASLGAIYLTIALISPIITPILENNLGKQELQTPVQMIIDAKQNNPSLLITLAFLAVIVAPLCEEFVFRGYIYATLKRFSCRFFATTISALFFALVHMNLWSMAPLFIIGITLAIIYETSNSLWAPILTHALFNGATVSILIFSNGPSNL